MSDHLPEVDEFAEKIRQLRPNSSVMDPRETFYRAGYEACRAESNQQSWKQAPRHHWIPGVIAACIGLFVFAPVTYHAGRTAGIEKGRQQIAVALTPSKPKLDSSDARPSVSTDGLQSNLDRAQAESTRGIGNNSDEPKNSVPSSTWLSPFVALTKSTQLDRQSKPTLTGSHASLFARQSAMRNLSDIPLTINEAVRESFGSDLASLPAPTVNQTLAVGDFPAFASDQEATR